METYLKEPSLSKCLLVAHEEKVQKVFSVEEVMKINMRLVWDKLLEMQRCEQIKKKVRSFWSTTILLGAIRIRNEKEKILMERVQQFKKEIQQLNNESRIERIELGDDDFNDEQILETPNHELIFPDLPPDRHLLSEKEEDIGFSGEKFNYSQSSEEVDLKEMMHAFESFCAEQRRDYEVPEQIEEEIVTGHRRRRSEFLFPVPVEDLQKILPRDDVETPATVPGTPTKRSAPVLRLDDTPSKRRKTFPMDSKVIEDPRAGEQIEETIISRVELLKEGPAEKVEENIPRIELIENEGLTGEVEENIPGIELIEKGAAGMVEENIPGIELIEKGAAGMVKENIPRIEITEEERSAEQVKKIIPRIQLIEEQESQLLPQVDLVPEINLPVPRDSRSSRNIPVPIRHGGNKKRRADKTKELSNRLLNNLSGRTDLYCESIDIQELEIVITRKIPPKDSLEMSEFVVKREDMLELIDEIIMNTDFMESNSMSGEQEEVSIERDSTEQISMDVVPIERGPIEEIPMEEVPIERGPIEEIPAEEVPVERGSIERGPIEEIPMEEGPIETGPIEEIPMEGVPIETGPVEEIPIENIENFEVSRRDVESDLHEKPRAETSNVEKELDLTRPHVSQEAIDETDERTEVQDILLEHFPVEEIQPVPSPVVAHPRISNVQQRVVDRQSSADNELETSNFGITEESVLEKISDRLSIAQRDFVDLEEIIPVAEHNETTATIYFNFLLELQKKKKIEMTQDGSTEPIYVRQYSATD